MLLSATSNGVGVNVRLIWEWMDRLCKGLSIPRNQGIYKLAWWKALQLSLLPYKVSFWTWIVFPQPMIIASLLPYKVSFLTWIVFPQPMMLALGEAYQ